MLQLPELVACFLLKLAVTLPAEVRSGRQVVLYASLTSRGSDSTKTLVCIVSLWRRLSKTPQPTLPVLRPLSLFRSQKAFRTASARVQCGCFENIDYTEDLSLLQGV